MYSDQSMEVPEADFSTKSKNINVQSKPRVIATEPDRTLERYVIDEFKAKAVGSKEVPFEVIDLSLYKPRAKLVGFGTSETRLPLWIQAVIDRYIDNVSKEDECPVQWEEIECYWEPNKPDKIRLLVKRNEEKLFVLTLFITTGRIQTQGVYYEQWATEEFPVLLQMVNALESNTPDSSLCQSKLFEEKEDKTTDLEENSKESNESDSSDEDEDEDENYDEDTLDDDSVSDTRLNSLNESYANIESDVTQFKANIERELYRINDYIDDLLTMKDKIVKIENGYKAWVANVDDKLYQSKCDLSSTNAKMNDLTCQVKKLQDQKQQMTLKQSEMKNDIADLKQENKELKKELFLLREIIAKHDNIIESDQKSTTSTSSDNSKANTNNPDISNQENPSKSKIPLSQQSKQTNNYDNDPNSLLLLCDSNGKFIKTGLLCPDINVELHKSFTVDQAMKELQNSNATHKTVVLHCGTNDLEKMDPASLIKESKKLIQSTIDRYPGSRIIYSSLLPRQDLLQMNVMEVNNAMEQYCHTVKH